MCVLLQIVHLKETTCSNLLMSQTTHITTQSISITFNLPESAKMVAGRQTISDITGCLRTEELSSAEMLNKMDLAVMSSWTVVDGNIVWLHYVQKPNLSAWPNVAYTSLYI